MKCKIIDCQLKPHKAEPVINEWLTDQSNINIKFIQETIIAAGKMRLTFYYED
jgi:hypothetical protein